ncbi:MAG: hypothetical protein PHS73_01300 [Candidatus Peribacteraceae bacterium]|nr:hypothetical protein [Candidatus Peribacteraceae bacterium]
METNPFATTLCIAVEPLQMEEAAKQRLQQELRCHRMSYWEYVIERLREGMYHLGIALDGVIIELKEEEDEDQQRYITVAGIRSDQACSVLAILENDCEVIDDDFNPVSQGEDPEDTWWRGDEGPQEK